MDIESLIEKVFLRAPIWDKRIKAYSNQIIVDHCWREISREMNIPDAILRNKWKNLVEMFKDEFEKIQQQRSGHRGGKFYESKWPHYTSLLFLQDVVKPRLPSILKSGKTTPRIESVDEMLDERQSGELNDFDDVGDSISNVSDIDDRKYEQHISVMQNENQDNEDVSNLHRSLSQNNSRKRKWNETEYNENITDMENTKADFFPETNQSENDDLLFFRSLLPHIANIPSHMKLRFRNRIQEAVEEFAYPQAFSTFQQPRRILLPSPSGSSSSALLPEPSSSSDASASTYPAASSMAQPRSVLLPSPLVSSTGNASAYPTTSSPPVQPRSVLLPLPSDLSTCNTAVYSPASSTREPRSGLLPAPPSLL